MTPIIFETQKEPFLFSLLSSEFLLLAYQSVPPTAIVYDAQGKQVSQIRFPSQAISNKLLSLSEEYLAMVDSSNPRILQILETRSGKQLSKFEHSSEILEVRVNHARGASRRKFLFFDSNKDLHLFFLQENKTRKVASMVSSFHWHETVDIFSYTGAGRLSSLYSPDGLLLDEDLSRSC